MAEEVSTLALGVDTREVVAATHDVDRLAGAMDGAERGAGAVAAAARTLATALAAVKISEAVRDATLAAARYNELGVVVATLGRNVSLSSTALAGVEASLRRTGISAIESRNNIAKMISAHIDLAKAADLARIAQDAAVIGQKNSSEAFAALVDGIQSAEVETLRAIGINVNFEQSYARMAAQLRKSADTLTENEKTQARVNAVLAQGPTIAGAYAAAMDTPLKQLRSLSRYADDAKVALGQAFQSQLSGAVEAAGVALKFAGDNAGALASATATVASGYAALKAINIAGDLAGQAQAWADNGKAARAAAAAAAEKAAADRAAAAAAVELAGSAAAQAEVDLLTARGATARTAAAAALTEAERLQTVATVEATAATEALNVAQSKVAATAATTGAAGAIGALKAGATGLMAALGGPVGLTVLLGTAAATWLAFRDNAADALRSSNRLLDEQVAKLSTLNDTQKAAAGVDAKKQAADARAQIAAIGAELRNEFGSLDIGGFLGIGGSAVKARAEFAQLVAQVSAGAKPFSEITQYVEKLGTATDGDVDKFKRLGKSLDDAQGDMRRGEAAMRLFSGTATDADRKLLGLAETTAKYAEQLRTVGELTRGITVGAAFDELRGKLEELDKVFGSAQSIAIATNNFNELQRLALEKAAVLARYQQQYREAIRGAYEQSNAQADAALSASLRAGDAAASATIARLDAQGRAVAASLGASGAALRQQLQGLMREQEALRNLPAGILDAIATVESRYAPNAVSGAGARGLMQFMPRTAAAYGIDPDNPEQSVRGAARYVADLLRQFHGNVDAALAAYNGGTEQGSRVLSGLAPNKEETRQYLEKIREALGGGVDIARAALADQDSIARQAAAVRVRQIDAEIAAEQQRLERLREQHASDAEIIAQTDRVSAAVDRRNQVLAEADAAERERHGDYLRERAALDQQWADKLADLQAQNIADPIARASAEAERQMAEIRRQIEADYGSGTDAARQRIEAFEAEISTRLQREKEALDPAVKLYERAAEQIYGGWSSMWEDLFDGGLTSMKDFGREMLSWFKRLLGQMVAQALARPVLVPVITALGGTLGMSQGAIGGTLQQLGLGGGAPTVGSSSGFGLSDLSSASNLFGGNSVGSALGGVLGAGQIGAYGAGATSTGAGLSFTGASSYGYGAAAGGSTLGNAAAGFSNLAYGAAGIGGGLIGGWIAPNSQYGSLAGSIGGVAGMVGAEAIGTAAGMAAGAAYGSVIPVIGTIVGAVLGGLIAKFSGDTEPNNMWFRVTSGARSGRDAKYAPLSEAQTPFGSVAVSGWEDLSGDIEKEFSAGIVDAFAKTDTALAGVLGAQYVDIARQAIDGQAIRSASWVETKDPASKVAAVFRDRYAAIFGAIDAGLAAAFDRQTVTADNVGQVVAELGELFGATHQAAQAATLGPYTQQLQALDAQFGRLTVNAQKYSYLVAEVADANAAAHARLTAAFNADVAAQIRQITDPTGVALDQLDQAFAVIRADAAAVGGDLAQVEQLYGLKRTEILREQLAEQQRIAEEAAAEQQRLSESLADIELRRQAALTQILGDPAQTAQYESNRRAVEAARELAAAQTDVERAALAAAQALEGQVSAAEAQRAAAEDARRHAGVIADLGLRRLQAQAGISGTDADREYAEGMSRQVARLRELSEAANDGERAVLAQVQAMEEQARVALAAREALAAAAAEQKRLTASLEDIAGRRLSAIAALSPDDTVKAYAATDYKTGIDRARELAAAQTDIERTRLREVYAIEDQVTAMQRQQAAADAAAKAEADRQAKIADARNAYIAALQREQSTLQQTRDRFRSLADGLGKYRGSLLVGDLSPLDYGAQIAEARRQFDDVSRRARLGDLGALDGLQGAAQTLLEESRSYNASSPAYAADFASVTDALSGAESLSVRQAEIAQSQLDTLNAQLKSLGAVEGSTQTLADAQAAYLAALAGQTQQQQTQHRETLTELQALVRVQATANQQLLDRLAALEARLAGMEAAARRSAAA